MYYCDILGFNNVLHKIQRARMVYKSADILENLTIDEELLAELQARGVITSEIADNIRCRPVDMDKNRYLCSFIYRQPKPKLDAFVDVLKKRKQDHVVKFIELDPEKLGKICFFPRHTQLECENRTYHQIY